MQRPAKLPATEFRLPKKTDDHNNFKFCNVIYKKDVDFKN